MVVLVPLEVARLQHSQGFWGPGSVHTLGCQQVGCCGCGFTGGNKVVAGPGILGTLRCKQVLCCSCGFTGGSKVVARATGDPRMPEECCCGNSGSLGDGKDVTGPG